MKSRSLTPEERWNAIRHGWALTVQELVSDDSERGQGAYDLLLPVAQAYGHATIEEFLKDELSVKSFLGVTQ